MRTLILLTVLIFGIERIYSQNSESFTDKRDGKTYLTVTIGQQTWFAENLSLKISKFDYVVYDNQNSNTEKYGCLYTYEVATKICPQGWHLPSDQDWKTLELFIGLSSEELESNWQRGKNLSTILKSQEIWDNNAKGTNNYGFSAIPAGAVLFYDNSFHFKDEKAYYWTSTSDNSDAIASVLSYDDTFIERAYFSKKNKMSVRCIKD